MTLQSGQTDTAAAERIAFVVIGRNEGPRLRSCLTSVAAQCHRIIYVDSMSTDGSVDLAQAMGALTVSLDSSSPLTAARGRRAGFLLLQQTFPDCEYVHFIDGDCVLVPGWVENAVEFLQNHPRVAAVCGRRFERHPEASFYNWMIDQEWSTPVGRAEACGGDALFRVSAMADAGGFRADLRSCEEPELCARIRAAGWEIWRLDHPMTEHDANIRDFGQWWKRAERAGFGYAQAWRVTRQLPQRLYGPLLFRVFFWAMAVPLLIILAAAFAGNAWLLLLLPLVYAVQVARMAAKKGASSIRSWRYALVMLLVKFPEALGAISYFIRPEPKRIFEYKRVSEHRDTQLLS